MSVFAPLIIDSSGNVARLASGDVAAGSGVTLVPFAASNASYTVPAGMRVFMVGLRAAAGGGAGGGAGGAGASANTGGGGGGAQGRAGGSAAMMFAPANIAAGVVLAVAIGAGGTAGSGAVFGVSGS